jgi:K+ transporter
MAGLLNVVPRYLPRYGMAPDWARMLRPLVLLNIGVAIVITLLFRADVDAQAGAYATGVLAMMLSASIAVLIFSAREGRATSVIVSAVTAAVLGYAIVANEVQHPDGIVITLFFIVGIVIASFTSRIARSTELRSSGVELDEVARRFLATADTDRNGQVMFVAHRPRPGDETDAYRRKEREQRRIHQLATREHVLFLEIEVDDASDFNQVLRITGHEVGPHRVLRGRGSTVPNAIAAFLIHVQAEFGTTPHCYFGWTEGNPFGYLLRFVLLGEGDTAPVTREVLRQAIDDPDRRPPIHVGG